MVELSGVFKLFNEVRALKNISVRVEKGSVCGLVGSNGSGKSTLMRIMAGIYKPDSGNVYLNKEEMNFLKKTTVAYVGEEPFFTTQSTLLDLSNIYAAVYSKFSFKRMEELADAFGLSTKKRVAGFSKGMKRQAAAILALSSTPELILLDESFDGLDPVMRDLVKKLIYSDMSEYGLTAIVSSHSLHELENSCDSLIFLHKGELVFSKNMDEVMGDMSKLQVAFSEKWDLNLLEGIEIVNVREVGAVKNVVIRGNTQKAIELIKQKGAKICQEIPMDLEEVFISELDTRGYSYKNIFEKGGEE